MKTLQIPTGKPVADIALEELIAWINREKQSAPFTPTGVRFHSLEYGAMTREDRKKIHDETGLSIEGTVNTPPACFILTG